MEGGNWVGKGMERGMGVSRSGMGRDRRDGQMAMKNEWKSTTDRGEEVGGISKMRQRSGIREVPKHNLNCDSLHWGYGT